jgi:tetratricopeptide (TPR) repeat protein
VNVSRLWRVLRVEEWGFAPLPGSETHETEEDTMRISGLPRILGGCLLLAACITTNALSQPQPVQRLRDRALDKASYVSLANQWREYIEKHGETADALVNLGRAQRYSGELEAATRAGKRAVELEPDNPKALSFYAECLIVFDGGGSEALKLLERSRAIAPDYGEALITLAVFYLRTGELDKAAVTLKTVFDRRIISRPLQDYAYNMLIGLPTGAVLITNGDNDTFSPLALQAGMDFRNDVIVINWTLLSSPEYVNALRRKHACLRSADQAKPGTATEDPGALIAQWIKDSKVPLYIAATVSHDRVEELGLKIEPVAEGLSIRASGKGLTPEETARVVLEQYRLDSATDWDFAWDLTPDLSNMTANNYVSSLVKLAQRDGMPVDLKCRLLGRAAAIAEFHHLSTEAHIKTLLKKCEAK